MTTAALILAARQRAGLTQTELARRSGIPQPSISAIERGKQEPRNDTVARLLSAAQVRPSIVLQRRRDDVVAAAARSSLTHVRVFGSAVYGTDRLDSDIDLLVTPIKGASLFDLTAFRLEVEELLGCRVDVVSDRGVGAAKAHIHREALSL